MKTVPVLALQRSGSSLLSGILHKLGVYMGPKEDLKKGRKMNKNGCYENQDIMRINISILVAAGGSWFIADNFKEKEVREAFNHFKPQFLKIIRRYERELWGWKYPFTYHTIPYLHEYLKNPHYIYLKRDKDSVIKSNLESAGFGEVYSFFKKETYGFKPECVKCVLEENLSFYETSTLLNWSKNFINLILTKDDLFNNKKVVKETVEKSYDKINSFVEDKRHLRLTFNDLINNSEESINDVIEYLDLNVSNKKKKEALRFVHPELVHF